MINNINVANMEDPISMLLSNFTDTPFIFGNITFLNAESFLQCIKFDSIEKQIEIASLEAHKARMKGKKRTKQILNDPYVYWQNKKIQIHSDEYYYLIYLALTEKFRQNLNARVALLLTDGLRLYFDNGFEEPKFNLFPNNIFINILIQIREDFKNSIRNNVKYYYEN